MENLAVNPLIFETVDNRIRIMEIRDNVFAFKIINNLKDNLIFASIESIENLAFAQFRRLNRDVQETSADWY